MEDTKADRIEECGSDGGGGGRWRWSRVWRGGGEGCVRCWKVDEGTQRFWE